MQLEGEENVRRAEGRGRGLYGYRKKEEEEEKEEELELDRDVLFGAICVGWAADLVGVRGKVDGTLEEFESALMRGVRFVMKGGVVYKNDGREVIDADGYFEFIT